MTGLINLELIKNYMNEYHLTDTSFCNACNIKLSTLNKIRTYNYDFDISELFKIARLLHIKIHEIFNE